MKHVQFLTFIFFCIAFALPGYAEKIPIRHFSLSVFTLENQPEASIAEEEVILYSYFEADADLLKKTSLFPRYKLIIKQFDQRTGILPTGAGVLKVLLATPSFAYISQSLALIFPHHYFW
jgi:hypothetical protein